MLPLLRILAIAWLAGCITPQLLAQNKSEVFGIKRTPDSRTCELPMVYFTPGTIQLEIGYDLELRYLAHLMKKYRKMSIRIRPDVVPAPGDVEGRLLLEERLSYIVAYMDNQYGIKRDRFIREEYKDISRGYEAPIAPPPPLVRRRVVCDCVWEKKSKRQKE